MSKIPHRVMLDCDTATEIDGQFAIADALGCRRSMCAALPSLPDAILTGTLTTALLVALVVLIYQVERASPCRRVSCA